MQPFVSRCSTCPRVSLHFSPKVCWKWWIIAKWKRTKSRLSDHIEVIYRALLCFPTSDVRNALQLAWITQDGKVVRMSSMQPLSQYYYFPPSDSPFDRLFSSSLPSLLPLSLQLEMCSESRIVVMKSPPLRLFLSESSWKWWRIAGKHANLCNFPPGRVVGPPIPSPLIFHPHTPTESIYTVIRYPFLPLPPNFPPLPLSPLPLPGFVATSSKVSAERTQKEDPSWARKRRSSQLPVVMFPLLLELDAEDPAEKWESTLQPPSISQITVGLLIGLCWTIQSSIDLNPWDGQNERKLQASTKFSPRWIKYFYARFKNVRFSAI